MIRPPGAALRPFVRQLWSTTTSGAPAREHTLPSPAMHLVVRVGGGPVRIADEEALALHSLSGAVVGGVRTKYYVKEMPGAVSSVGLTFHPAAAGALFGYTADELAGRHHALSDFWSRAAVAELEERLHGATDAATQLDILEDVIARRVPRLRGLHPAVAATLAQLRITPSVTAAVRASGYSHRTVAEAFRRTMGIAPKAYLQVSRMQWVLAHAGAVPWSELAAQAGFSDQAHFARDFKTFAGATPTGYLRARATHPSHFRILQDSTRTAR